MPNSAHPEWKGMGRRVTRAENEQPFLYLPSGYWGPWWVLCKWRAAFLSARGRWRTQRSRSCRRRCERTPRQTENYEIFRLKTMFCQEHFISSNYIQNCSYSTWLFSIHRMASCWNGSSWNAYVLAGSRVVGLRGTYSWNETNGWSKFIFKSGFISLFGCRNKLDSLTWFGGTATSCVQDSNVLRVWIVMRGALSTKLKEKNQFSVKY